MPIRLLRTATLLLTLASAPAWAQVLTVLSDPAMAGVVTALAPGFQNKTGVRVRLVQDSAAALQARIDGGEAFDIVVLPRPLLDALAARGRVQRASITPLGRQGEDYAHARGPVGVMDDAAEVYVNALNGYTATEVMKVLGIEPLR